MLEGQKKRQSAGMPYFAGVHPRKTVCYTKYGGLRVRPKTNLNKPSQTIPLMMSNKRIIFGLACLLPLMAQAAPAPELPTASVTAHVSTEVPQDEAHASLYVEQTGADRAKVVSEVNAAVKGALNLASTPVKVKTGGYRSFPLYDKNQHISGYRVRADVSLESKDFEAFSKTLTTLSSTLSVQDVGYSVSDEALNAVKSHLLTQVAGEFRTEAGALSHAFGFSRYNIKDLNVNYDTGALRTPVMKAVAFTAVSPSSAEVPAAVEPGTTTVTATANGTIILN
jgi:predicted secreted protein